MHFFTNLNLNIEIFISLEWSSLYIFLEGSKNTEKRRVVDAAAVFAAVRGNFILWIIYVAWQKYQMSTFLYLKINKINRKRNEISHKVVKVF